MPIYQASGMMSKALGVYQTYIDSLNEDIKRVFNVSAPSRSYIYPYVPCTCDYFARASSLWAGASERGIEVDGVRVAAAPQPHTPMHASWLNLQIGARPGRLRDACEA